MRAAVAVFNAAAMALFAMNAGAASPLAQRVLWGSAVAAVVVAGVTLRGRGEPLAWIAIGYVLYAAILAPREPLPLLLALAAALATVAPRPRQSLATGIVIAVVAAFAAREIVSRVT